MTLTLSYTCYLRWFDGGSSHSSFNQQAYDIPSVNLCNDVKLAKYQLPDDPTTTPYRGAFDCADGSWMHNDDSICCEN